MCYCQITKAILGRPGNSESLIKDGKLVWEVMKKNQVTEENLREMIRETLNHNDLKDVKEARLERTGRISFIKKQN